MILFWESFTRPQVCYLSKNTLFEIAANLFNVLEPHHNLLVAFANSKPAHRIFLSELFALKSQWNRDTVLLAIQRCINAHSGKLYGVPSEVFIFKHLIEYAQTDIEQKILLHALNRFYYIPKIEQALGYDSADELCSYLQMDIKLQLVAMNVSIGAVRELSVLLGDDNTRHDSNYYIDLASQLHNLLFPPPQIIDINKRKQSNAEKEDDDKNKEDKKIKLSR